MLGPLQVDGRVDGLGPRDRVVLSALLVRAGDTVSTELLAHALWGEQPPASWAKVVQGCVVRLRKRLGAAAIRSGPGGYRLTLTDDELDHRLFERLLERGREALAGGDAARSSYLAQEALELWRGRALTDLEEWEPGRVEAQRLEGMRMDAEELRVEAEIRSGRAPAVLEQARALVAEAAFRERRWVLLATALHQSGRQADALGALHRARAMLVGELGLDPGPELVDLEQLLLRQDPSLRAPEDRPVSSLCPYRGLLPYGAEDADSFFGRGEDVAACLRRLRDSGALTVIGPSGVGKSSLVLAGVVASLRRSGVPVLVTAPGVHPMASLHGLRSTGRQTLVVDQAEEAVTVCTDPAERDAYVAALAGHVASGGALVLTLRADHIGDLARYPDIARVVEEGLYLLGPMSVSDLRSAILGPARRAGLRLEPGLVDLLVEEVEGEPAALPLLSHVLRATWERREGPTLTVEGYRATGGIRYAVAQSAETLYDAMDVAQRNRLRGLLLRLVVPTEDGEPLRARASRAKVAVDAAHLTLVEQLVDARLISVDGDSVQIAHEALVRVWPRLRGWLDDDVDGQRLFRHLAGTADAWHAMGRPDSELYRGARLSRTLEWRDRSRPDLDETEADFLAASVDLSETELRAAELRIKRERTVNRRLRGALVGVAGLLVLTLVAGVLAVGSGRVARRDRDRAQAAAEIANARQVGTQALSHEFAATALLLGVAALQVDPSPQARENLAATLTRLGSLQRIQSTGDLGVSLAASGGKVAVSLPVDGVRLFDASTLEPLEFSDDTPASAVTFSPDGRLMAVAVNQWTPSGPPRISTRPVRLFEMPSGRPADRELGGWPVGASVEYSLAFSRDGSRIAAGVQRYDGRGGWQLTGAVMVWDVAAPERPVFTVSLPELAQAALSPDGRRLYVATTGPRFLRVYDVGTGRLLRWAPPASTGQAAGLKAAIDVSPDGRTLAVAQGSSLLRFDTGTLDRRGAALQGHTGGVTDVEYSHDGTMLLSASTDRSTVVWEPDSGAQLRRFAAHADESWSAGFSPDDRSVYSAAGDGTLMSWDVTGRFDLVSAGRNISQGQDNGVSMVAPDGHTVARLESGRLWFLDTRTGQATRATTDREIETYAWSPDGHTFVSSSSARVSSWDPTTGTLLAEHDYPGYWPAVLAFGLDGDLFVRDGHGAIETLDPSTMRVLHGTATVTAGVPGLVAHPRDGTVLALKSNGSITRVNSASGAVVATSRASLLSAEGIGAISPDGSRLAVADSDGHLRLLDVDTLTWVGGPSRTEWGHNVVYAPDGSQFASVQADRVRLWDGRTGAYEASVPLADLPASGLLGPASLGPGVSVAYLPDSRGLLVAAADGRTWTVDTRTGEWVRRACLIAGRNLTRDEWHQSFPSRPYRRTCPQWPAGA